MKDQIIKILDEEIRKLIKEQMGVGEPFNTPGKMPTKRSKNDISKTIADYYNSLTDAGMRLLAGDSDFIGGEMTLAPKIFNDNINSVRDDFDFRVFSFSVFLGPPPPLRPDTAAPRYSQEVELKINKLARSFQAVEDKRGYNPYTASLAKSKTSTISALEETKSFILSDLKLGASVRWKSILEEIDIETQFADIIKSDIRLDKELLKQYVIPIFLFGEPFSNIVPRVAPNLDLIKKIKDSQFFGLDITSGGSEFNNKVIAQTQQQELQIKNLQGFLSTITELLVESGVYFIPGGLYIIGAYEAIGLAWLGVSLLKSFVLDYNFSRKINNILEDCRSIFAEGGLLHQVINEELSGRNIDKPNSMAEAAQKFMENFDLADVEIITNKVNSSNQYVKYESSIRSFTEAVQLLSNRIIEKTKQSDQLKEIKSLIEKSLFDLSSGVGLENDLISQIIIELSEFDKLEKGSDPCYSWGQIKKGFIEVDKLAKKTDVSVKRGEVQESRIQIIIDEEIRKIIREQKTKEDKVSMVPSTQVFLLNPDGTKPNEQFNKNTTEEKVLANEHYEEMLELLQDDDDVRSKEFEKEPRFAAIQFNDDEYESYYKITSLTYRIIAAANQVGRSASVMFAHNRCSEKQEDPQCKEWSKMYNDVAEEYYNPALEDMKDLQKYETFYKKWKEDFIKEKGSDGKIEPPKADYDYTKIKEGIKGDLLAAEEKLESIEDAEGKKELEQGVEDLEKVSKKIDKTIKDVDKKLENDELPEDIKENLKENKKELTDIKKDIDEAIKSAKGRISELPNDPTEGPEEKPIPTPGGQTDDKIPGGNTGFGDKPDGTNTGPTPGEGGSGIPGGIGMDPENDPTLGKFCYDRGIFEVATYGKVELRTGKIGQSKLFASSKTTVDLIREFNEIVYRVTKAASTKWRLDSEDEKENIFGTIDIHVLEGFGPRVNAAAAPLFKEFGDGRLLSFEEYFSESVEDPRYKEFLGSEDDISLEQQYIIRKGSMFAKEGAQILNDGNANGFYQKYIAPIIQALGVTLNSTNCVIMDPDKPSEPRMFRVRGKEIAIRFKDLKFNAKTESPGPVFADALQKAGVAESSSTPLRDSIVFLISLNYLLKVLRTGAYDLL